jgi:hypothetical protein
MKRETLSQVDQLKGKFRIFAGVFSELPFGRSATQREEWGIANWIFLGFKKLG